MSDTNYETISDRLDREAQHPRAETDHRRSMAESTPETTEPVENRVVEHRLHRGPNDNHPAGLRDLAPTAEGVSNAADSMEEFNRLLWELAKSFWIITLMLLGAALVAIAYYAVEFMVTL